MRLHWKLMATYTLVIVLVMASVHLYLGRALRQFLLDRLEYSLIHEVQLAGDLWDEKAAEDPSPEGLHNLADLLSRRLEARVTLIEGGGRVLADSDVPVDDLPDLENHADRPEVRDAWKSGSGSSLRYSTTVRQEMLYVAGVIPGLGDGRTVMRLSLPLREIAQVEKRIQRAIWSASLLGLALALVLAYGGGRFVARPIVRMTQIAHRMASGDFLGCPDVPSPAVREVRDLSMALNTMCHQIQDRLEQVTREKSRLQAVLASITEGILVTEHDGRVLMANRAMVGLFGISADPQGCMPIELVRHEEVHEAIERTLATGEETVFEMVLPGALERHLDVHVAPILQEERCIGSVTVFYDISELRRLERVRQDFVANVSHELRTPLTAIKGCAATLAEGALSDREAAERFVRSINSHADRLHRLLDDLLDLSRLESDALELAPEVCAVRRTVENALGPVKPLAQEKEIAVDVAVPEDLLARCDPKLVEQALVNLLDNSIKYTPKGGSVRVTVRRFTDEEAGSEGRSQDAGMSAPSVSLDAGEGRLRRREDAQGQGGGDAGRIAVEVSDTGIGIPSDELPRVFERFYRVDKGRSRAMGGTGLGLSIVRHIVESHGEEVYVESELGKGSTFGFTLPSA